MHVCPHTENGKPACDPCHNPMNHIKRDSFGKHGQLVNNISMIYISDSVGYGDETVGALVKQFKQNFKLV